ncbi:MAG: DUF2442 domain-containing protein [Verrucomicrobiales bacterium]|jgi:hypothetical protein|nr:DUF2442 domain-containing protein [Verrucomicrobiales bacterium]
MRRVKKARADRFHHVESLTFNGRLLRLRVDGRRYRVDFAAVSERLAAATAAERRVYEVSPSGYGIHWSLIDEDLTIDRLIRAAGK